MRWCKKTMTVFQKRLLSCLMPSLSSKFCSSVLKPNLGSKKVKSYKYVECGEFAGQVDCVFGNSIL